MESVQPAVRIYGTRGSAACYSIRDFLHRSDIPFRWIDLTTDEQASTEARVSGLDDARLPICVFPDGARLERATVRQITENLGWFRSPSREEYDLAIYGAGPAGLSASVYASSEGLKTILIERYAVGGQAGSSPKIENYLGFPQGISGAELAERAREQACHFGTEILLHREGVRGEVVAGKGVGYLADGTKIIARASICATGVDYRRLGLPNEDRFFGAGVYYGAGASEAMLCERQHVFVVGGGNSAGQAALHFAGSASKVTMVVRENSLKAYLSDIWSIASALLRKSKCCCARKSPRLMAIRYCARSPCGTTRPAKSGSPKPVGSFFALAACRRHSGRHKQASSATAGAMSSPGPIC
jgi:thioredoxin reductase (NADPH)